MTTLLHRLKHALAGYDFAPPQQPILEPAEIITDLMPAATLLTEQERLVSPFTAYGNIPLPLTRGRMLRFQLTPYHCDTLTGLRLRVLTFLRVNHTHLVVRIAGQQHRLNVRDFIDHQYFHIHFPEPIPCKTGQPIEIELFSDDADETNCIALACSRLALPFCSEVDFAPLHFDDSQPARVSIVIPVYNKVLYTYHCLVSVQQFDSEIAKEIIIINNNSSDETDQLLAQLTGAIKVVNNSDNQGFVGACRQGADLAEGEFILFLNNDTQVLSHWLESLVKVMEGDEQVGIVGSKLIYPDGRLQEAGGIIFSDASGCNYGREQDPTLPYFNESREVDYCSGASLMIRRTLWQQLGGFDERYAPAYYEDTDLCFAAREAGFRVWYCHESEVIHHEGITAGTDVNSGYKAYQNINRDKFIEKWQAVLDAEHYPAGTDFDVAIRRLERGNAYQQRYEQEIANYKHVENVHDLPKIAQDYWGPTHLLPLLQPFGFEDAESFYALYMGRLCVAFPTETCQFISIGAGNGDTESNVVQRLLAQGIHNFVLTCLDINEHMLARGRALAIQQNIEKYMDFMCSDINGWQSDKTYHVVMANQSLHHFVELEYLFNRIAQVLHPQGYFLTHDMIGRNGHMRWPEALEMVDELWDKLPERQKYNHLLQRHEAQYINWDCSQESFEGIRAQDILPLLLARFNFALFIGYSNVIDVFIDRCFGHNFDIDDSDDIAFIDHVQQIDQAAIEAGKVKPTHMYAALMQRDTPCQTQVYKHLTPEFCVRKVE